MPASQYLYEGYIYVKSIFRERQLLFWTIVFPLVYLSIIVAVFGNPGGSNVSFSVAIQDLDNSTLSITLIDAIRNAGIYRVAYVNSSLEEVIRGRGYDVGLIIPRGFGENLTTANQTYVSIVYVSNLQSSEAAKSSLESFIDRFGSIYVEKIIEIARSYMPVEAYRYAIFMAKPISSSYTEVKGSYISTPEGRKTYYVISTIGFMILYSGLFTSVGSIVEARRSGVLQLILSSPIKGYRIFIARIISGIVSISITSTAIILLGIALGADLYRIPAYIWIATALLLLVGAIGIMGLGFIIAPFIRTSEAATAIANMIAFPTMFLGGITIPKFLLPSSLQIFANIYPLSRIVDSIRNIAIYGWETTQAIQYSAPAIAASIAILVIGWILYRRALEKALENP
ncbi:MAG: ABC transporter permease [Desulfurococcales archaeon]